MPYHRNELADPKRRKEIEQELKGRVFSFRIFDPREQGQTFGFAKSSQFPSNVFFQVSDFPELRGGFQGGEEISSGVRVSFNRKKNQYDFSLCGNTPGKRTNSTFGGDANDAQKGSRSSSSPVSDYRSPERHPELVGQRRRLVIEAPTDACRIFGFARDREKGIDLFFLKFHLSPAVHALQKGDRILGNLETRFSKKHNREEIQVVAGLLLPWGGLWHKLLSELSHAHLSKRGASLSEDVRQRLTDIGSDAAEALDGWSPLPDEQQTLQMLSKEIDNRGEVHGKERIRARLEKAKGDNPRFGVLLELLDAYDEFIRQRGGIIPRPPPRQDSQARCEAKPIQGQDDSRSARPFDLADSDSVTVQAVFSPKIDQRGAYEKTAWIAGVVTSGCTLTVDSRVSSLDAETALQTWRDLADYAPAKCIPFLMHYIDPALAETGGDTLPRTWPSVLRLVVEGLVPDDAPASVDVNLCIQDNAGDSAWGERHSGYFSAWASSGTGKCARKHVGTVHDDHRSNLANLVRKAIGNLDERELSRLPMSIPLTPEVLAHPEELAHDNANVSIPRLFRLIPSLRGTLLWHTLVGNAKSAMHGAPKLQQEFLATLERKFEEKSRNLRELRCLIDFAMATIDVPDEKNRLRSRLLWALITIQNANHHGEPERARDEAATYFRLRPKALELDRELVAYADLNLAVHYADQFEFDQARAITEELVQEPHFEALSALNRGRAISALGQYLAMQGETAEADAHFAEALRLFDESGIDPEAKAGEQDQTSVYRAINALDSDAEDARHLVEQVVGPLDKAVEQLATSSDITRFYHHHLLVRALVLLPDIEPELADRYIESHDHWFRGKQHPWALIGLYRALLLFQGEGEQRKEQSCQSFANAISAIAPKTAGATMALIGGGIATVAFMHFNHDVFCKVAHKLLDRAAQELPAAENSVTEFRRALESPGVKQTPHLLNQLPFNYH